MRTDFHSPILTKVPEVTLYFWIIKIMATTVGETAADYLNVDLGLGLAVTSWIMAALFIAALWWQLWLRRYVASVYWLTVIFISVVGTLITDNLTDHYGVPLWISTAIFSVLLAITFLLWYVTEGTLSIHSIFTRRRELFYWTAILVTFALGTAGGDFATEGLGWGYFQGVLIFGGLIAFITFGYYFLRLDAVLAFWVAYVLTRPLGASIGDLLTQSQSDGGLGINASWINIGFFLMIVGLIVYLTWSKVDQPGEATRL